ncbi:MAG: 4-(cytidine 5'-diphospho)-2-C-methyl-D-erythritol kinase [Syntrophomonadaceae bacterium]|nr:4-(cytidine 5'-diphospho)-2-C-methyl-D-erythritol kinase [Syntrophomonadaceae bacterium]
MQTVIIEAPAKINLTLDVKGKRSDGYHELETVMHQVNLFDRVTLEPRSSGIEMATNSSSIPLGQENLAYKAALMVLQEYQPGAGVKIFIEKNIPVGAGLAGGSTDAAAVLAGINHLYDCRFSRLQLLKMAAAIGSDVAFCMSGQYYQPRPGELVSRGTTAIARGRGELLESLPTRIIPYILIVKPDFELSTVQVYSELDLKAVEQFPDTRSFLQVWNKGDIINISVYMANVLESVSIRKKPEIGIIKSRLMEMGALNALMSGSGPSVFAIFPDNETASKAYQAFKKEYREVYLLSSYKRGDKNGS